jgi:hypothetical protein
VKLTRFGYITCNNTQNAEAVFTALSFGKHFNYARSNNNTCKNEERFNLNITAGFNSKTHLSFILP